MNTKEIAEIIKKRIQKHRQYFQQTEFMGECCTLCIDDTHCSCQIKIDELKEFANELADYFEKEDIKTAKKYANLSYECSHNEVDFNLWLEFNRKQFFEWAGISNE